uniref:E3 ubiquitin-protein ligase Topors n=1 Tax=Tetraodon nigroviridis TaxID=99883 RepID=H3DL07_TETNG
IALQQSRNPDRRKECKRMSAQVSPDSKCPICLDVFNNISYLDICLHKFCFRCIHEWSKNKAECPLCKQPFHSIYHSIKSENDYKQYDLRPLENGSFGIFGGARFRYRTTLTGINQQRQGRTTLPPDNGVMFEASTNPHRYMRNMMLRLAARRVAANEGRSVSSIREQEMINFRRELYRRGVRVRNVTDGGRSRDISAQFFRRNPACLHRLIPWLKRELTVLYGGHGSLVNIVQHIVMSQITRYDMDDGAIEEELRPFLQGRAEQFLHEFISFAKSPFDMQAYDRHAVYDCPGPSNDDSSTNSSVIAISEDEEQTLDLDLAGEATSSLRYSAWDDETPGPSYSTTAQRSRTEYMSVLDSDSDSSSEETRESETFPRQLNQHSQTDAVGGRVQKEECTSSDSDECVIIGFTKPLAERTPELVKLSSDSEDDEKETPPLPQHIRFSSLSPIASRSTDHSSAGRSENLEMDDSKKGRSTAWYGVGRCSRPDRNDRQGRSESNDRVGGRHRSKEESDQRSHPRRFSRSPAGSHSRDRGSFYSRDKHYSKSGHSQRRYSQESYYRSRYNQERRSYYYSSHTHLDPSSSRSCSRESQKWHRCPSRSRSYSGSPSPSNRKTRHHDKPGGKRKYKSRHLDTPADHALLPSPASARKSKKKSNKKHRKKSKERSRTAGRSRSRSFEPPERDGREQNRRHRSKKKKKHKKSKRHKSSER